MNTKLSITMFALLCVAASAGMAFAESYEVNWFESASCVDGSKCTCSEVSAYIKGFEATTKKTIAPLPNHSWQSMTLNNPNPFGACTMVLTALNCGYYACKQESATTSHCGYWKESASVELTCNTGKAYVEYYTNTQFRVNFQVGP